MSADVRYCRTDDGVQIAYTVYGSGPPLVIAPYFFESFDNDYRTAVWFDFLAPICAGRQVLRFDNRGVGLSQREGAELSAAGFNLDLEAVVDAAGLESFDLLGWVVGGASAMNFAAKYPAKLAHLALYACYARSTDIMPREALNSLATLCRTNWQMASRIFTDMSTRVVAPELGLTLAESFRSAVSGDVVAAILEDHVDYTGVLSQIEVPTLVLHRVNDSAVPFACSQKVASLISDARLIPLKGDINYPPLGDWEAVVRALRDFLEPVETANKVPADTLPAGFRTILFTDLVGHTAMMRRLGDERGREVLRDHERIIRDVLREHGGAEVKTMGDGFMASFPSVTRAVECALALQRAFADRNETASEPLRVRVGLNAGEPIEDEGDLFGETVILAARIAAIAQGGEILASMAVRELCAGKGFLFADMGEQVMRGFEDPVRVFEIKRPA